MTITIRIDDDGIIRPATAGRCGCSGTPKAADAPGPPLTDDCPEAVGTYVPHYERKADGSCVKTMQPA